MTPGSVVLDIGANRGLFTLYAAAAGATVIAIEGQSSFARHFDDLMSRNNVSNRVSFVHAIVGQRTGMASDPRFQLEARELGEVPPVRELAEILATYDVSHVDLCKMDIEGSEFDVFGNPEWLDQVDRLTMEVHSAFGDPESIATICEVAGFDVTRSTPNQRPVRVMVGDGLLHAVRRSICR